MLKKRLNTRNKQIIRIIATHPLILHRLFKNVHKN